MTKNDDDVEPEQKAAPSKLGFIPYQNLDWGVPSGNFASNLMGTISGKVTCCHPADPELYWRLIQSLRNSVKKLPNGTVEADTYQFFQDVTKLAIDLSVKWDRSVQSLPKQKPTRKTRKSS